MQHYLGEGDTVREFFMTTDRIGFSHWKEDDVELAQKLWGEKDVTRFICATGEFSKKDIQDRLNREIQNGSEYNVQYWPIFSIATGDFIGCCGVRPFEAEANAFEIGFHLRKEYWGKGYAFEAASRAIHYCFTELNAEKLFAGHHPLNEGSKKLLTCLGFTYIGDNFYEPTGLFHPSYEMKME